MYTIIGLCNGATKEFHTLLKILDTFASGVWCAVVICFNKAFVKINLKHRPVTSFVYLGLN